MPRVNGNELDDYLDDREPRREVRKLKKKMLDNAAVKKPPTQTPKE